MTTNNYILARWRDAIKDPPPFLWKGQVMDMAGGTHYMIRRTADFIDHLGRVAAPDAITSWLDVTTIPGVPREAVQAAVLEMRGQPPFGCDTWEVALDILQKHCGIEATPTEVAQ
jgi:hypothetical protein